MIEYTKEINHALISYLTETDQGITAIGQSVEANQGQSAGALLSDLNHELLGVMAELSDVISSVETHCQQAREHKAAGDNVLRGVISRQTELGKKILDASSQGLTGLHDAQSSTLGFEVLLRQIHTHMGWAALAPGKFLMAENTIPEDATACSSSIGVAIEAATKLGKQL